MTISMDGHMWKEAKEGVGGKFGGLNTRDAGGKLRDAQQI